MARRFRRRRGHNGMTIPIAPVLGLVAGLAEPAKTAMQGNFNGAVYQAMLNYTGYSTMDGRFYPEYLGRGLAPLIMGLVVHKFVGGSPLNLNKTLAASRVPFIRI